MRHIFFCTKRDCKHNFSGPWRRSMLDLQPYSLNLILIKNVEDTLRFLKTKRLKKQKHGYLILS